MRRALIISFLLIFQILNLNHLRAQEDFFTQGDFPSIENIHFKALQEEVDIHWNLNYLVLSKLDKESTILIRYNLKMDQERFEKGYSDKGWSLIEDISTNLTRYQLKNLLDNEEYVFQLGLKSDSQIDWSDTYVVKTKNKWGLFEFFVLLGSLALFLYGMKIMSDGLQQATGKKLRHILGSITSNSFKGILTGLGITTLVQSSSVTTVMVVSFVNAGILTLTQAAGVIMGANIGTTVTAWLIDIFGFKVDIGPYTLILLAIGIPLFFLNSSKLKSWASVIIGFALLFLGLGFLKDSVPEVGPDSAIVSFFVGINNIPYFSTVIAVLFGALLTVLIQSSSATVALTMTLMVSGVIPFEVGAAMVLGENIGTTITAELAASVGNVHAKRAARIHSSFNLFGVVIALLFFPFFLKLVVGLTANFFGGNPIDNPTQFGSTGLAVLHTTFNLTNSVVMVWFIPYLVRFAEFTVKSKGGTDEKFQLEYIGEGLHKTPELSIAEVKKELAKFGEITSRMSGFSRELLTEDNRKKKNDLYKRIKKYEGITDEVEVEIANYLIKISSKNLSEGLAKRVSGMNRIITNLERIGDIFYKISLLIEKMNENEISFSAIQEQRLLEMFDLVDEAFANMNSNLIMHSEDVTLDRAKEIELKLNYKRDEIQGEYYSNILVKDKTSTVEAALIYNNIFNLLERIGDHIMNVSEGIMGKVQ